VKRTLGVALGFAAAAFAAVAVAPAFAGSPATDTSAFDCSRIRRRSAPRREQVLFGPGLTNPAGADVHFVVHDHDALGVVQSVSTIGKEINSLGELPGNDLQFSAHET
jgi:hypothetical protein